VLVVLTLAGAWALKVHREDAERPSDDPSVAHRDGEVGPSGRAPAGAGRAADAAHAAERRSLEQIYAPRSWRDLLVGGSRGEFETDRHEMLVAIRSLCDAGSSQRIPEPDESTQEQAARSLAIVQSLVKDLCAGYQSAVVDAQLQASANPDAVLTEMRTARDMPSDLDQVRSPALYVLRALHNVEKSFGPEVERTLGMALLPPDRQQAIRASAAVDARCQLFPGCAPTSYATLATCLPFDCRPGLSLSQHWMNQALEPNEQVVAGQLAGYLVRRHRSTPPSGPR
jgi:hypothetical protein